MSDTTLISLIDSLLKQMGVDTHTIQNTDWEHQPISLEFEKIGTLHIEASKSGLLIALAKEIATFNLAHVLRRALRFIHHKQQLPISVQAGLKGGNTLLFMAVLPSEKQSLSDLNETIDLLGHLHQKVSEHL
jgi:type III secretion system chaperone SycN